MAQSDVFGQEKEAEGLQGSQSPEKPVQVLRELRKAFWGR